MTNELNMGATNQAIAGLENRLNELISVCAHLKEENTQLQNENVALLADRGQLMANRDKVRNQVEAMIGRLKAMEDS
jgi:cell division protein ZapB